MKTVRKLSFKEMVIRVVSSIPRGSVMTYGEVAYRAGCPGAFRAVGTIMSKNTDKSVPCHRVIRADGKPGGYNGLRGVATKRQLLESEGYRFK